MIIQKQQPGIFRVPVMENYKINLELETGCGVSGSGTGEKYIRKLFDWMFYLQQEQTYM